tara:strand:+ start:1321 stop:2289 length:969 start_codon:yes stop_codon:yes gene_type:complete
MSLENNQELESTDGSESFEQEQSLEQNQDKQLFDELGLDPSKYGLDLEGKKEEIQTADDQENTGAPTQETSILEAISKMNLIHNDNPIKIESEDDLKRFIQQGVDYTSKTQNLSEERKRWDVEKSQAETELNGAIEEFNKAQESYAKQLEEMQVWQHTFNALKMNTPDVFEEVQHAFNQTANQYKNPIIEAQLKAMQTQLSEAMKGAKQQEYKGVLDSFERDKQSMSSTEQVLKDLGINVDWDKVKTEWKETGLPVNKVVGSMYFEQIAKAQASKAKVQSTEKKIAVKSGVGAAAKTGKMVPQVKNTKDYLSMAYELYNNMK